MSGKFVIIDPAAGVSGDMLLGALIGAGADPAWLRGLPARLGIPQVTVVISDVDRAGIRATKVTVELPGGVHEGPGEAHGHVHHAHGPEPHPHGHGSHSHRHVGELLRLVNAAPLSAWVRERAERTFRLLAEAEGRIHGMAPEDVALHEVGALDALVDIVGVVEGFEQLGVSRIHHGPVAPGHGWVTAAHGVMAVPTPATALLLEGMTLETDGPAQGEATTPTGAALLRALSSGAPPAAWRLAGAPAYGAGERNPAGYANVVRLLLAEPADEAAEIVVLATDVDDLSPEFLEPVREALTEAGAVDVQVWSTMGKKGRVSFRIEALVPPDRREAVGQALLQHSTTIGLRWWRAARTTLERREVLTRAEDGSPVRLKVVQAPDGLRSKPELDDIQAVARATGRPAYQVARELQDHPARPGTAAGRGSANSKSEE